MTAIAKPLTWCVVLGLSLSAVPVTAGPHPGVYDRLSSLAVAGQTAASDERSEQKNLLLQSREAMAKGEIDLARWYLEKAERMDVKRGLFDAYGDTPEKVRGDLEKATREGAGSPERPSNRFLSSAGGVSNTVDRSAPAGRAASADPFRSRDAEAALDLMVNDAKTRATGELKQARLALSQDNTSGAVSWYKRAVSRGASFGPTEDSPQRLAQELMQRGVLSSQLAANDAFAASPLLIEPSDVDRTAGVITPAPRPASMHPTPTGQIDNPYAIDQDRAPSAAGNPASGPVRLSITDGDRTSRFTAPPASVGILPEPNVGRNRGPAGVSPLRMTDRSAPAAAGPSPTLKDQAVRMLNDARLAMDRGDLDSAQQLAQQADNLRVPDAQFGPGDPRPGIVLMQIASAKKRLGGHVAQAGGLGQTPADGRGVEWGLYQPSRDPTRNVPAQNPAPAEPRTVAPPVSQGETLFHQGLEALKAGDLAGARKLFEEAWKYKAELDPITREQLQGHVQISQTPAPMPQPTAEPSPLGQLDAQQRALLQRVVDDIRQETSAARTQSQTDPMAARDRLALLRQKVAQAEIDATSRRQLLTRVDRDINDLDRFIEQNRAQIDLDTENGLVRAEVEQLRADRLDTQRKLAELVDEFNGLMEAQRFPEAVVIAKQARELDPQHELVQTMLWKSRFAERLQMTQSMRERTARGLNGAMDSVQESGIPWDDRRSMRFPKLKDWNDLTVRRLRRIREGQTRYSEKEMAIIHALDEQVQVDFQDVPLGAAIDQLRTMTGIIIMLDPEGLTAEGVSTDQAVSLNTGQQSISLRSTLNLILRSLNLSYVVQDEVLRVTSAQTSEADVFTEVYNVADLVIPIPNFIPSSDIGLPGIVKEAINSQGGTTPGGLMTHAPMAMLAGNDTQANANGSVLAQMSSLGRMSSPARAPTPVGLGPGGLGGGVQADFDTLTELITSTIAPTTWDEVGGPGSIAGFDTNLSLVVSQTQEVHEDIVDLLQQLRRLQDLQVTIEVRFITLNDNFFERIGVDFDFDIDDNTEIDITNPAFPDDTGPSITFGLNPQGTPTADLDLQFTQGGFATAVPQFGNFAASNAANFGFAILSDIEAFFLIQAAQGDVRTNVLQAPKVTLFNGQQAFISDTSQRPFVTSIIPVVGDFAAAQQPVIVVLSEGTSLSVQAVVSQDRRFVRLTLVPFFSKIGDVEEFTFEGTTTSNTGTAAVDPSDPTGTVNNGAQQTTQGTTVQLPTFAFTTVTTTVSVPDGGTILLGGIKRLSEGRNEQGVPMLSKLPYVNRLFKNVGIGRSTQSLMMMVTPRIIIQEEEEEKLGLVP